MLELKNINTQVGDFALKDVNLRVDKGDYYILLGVSGAGKSLILETIAGLLTPKSGSIILDGEDITHEKIQNRSIGIVFQDHAVFPHMSVYENIAYSLHGRKLSATEKKEKIKAIAAHMNISSLLHRQPSTLSGGELQRVALARTLVQEPKVLLLDEPLASMDVQLKSEMRSLLRLLNRNGQTILHVSHSYEEAVALGNRIAVINKGTVLQQGSTDDILENPASEFVAHFTGAKNFYPVIHHNSDGNSTVSLSENVKVKITKPGNDNAGFVMIKNEDIVLSETVITDSDYNSFSGVVMELEKLPCGTEVLINIGVPVYVTLSPELLSKLRLKPGTPIWVSFRSSDLRFLG